VSADSKSPVIAALLGRPSLHSCHDRASAARARHSILGTRSRSAGNAGPLARVSSSVYRARQAPGLVIAAPSSSTGRLLRLKENRFLRLRCLAGGLPHGVPAGAADPAARTREWAFSALPDRSRPVWTGRCRRRALNRCSKRAGRSLVRAFSLGHEARRRRRARRRASPGRSGM